MNSKLPLITLWFGVFLVVFSVYTFLVGNQTFVLITDAIAALLAGVAVFYGCRAVKRYGVKSLHGLSLLLILLGIFLWFAAELVWLFFFDSAYLLVESTRLLGYVPLTIGFFYILQVSDPKFRTQKKNIFITLGIFLLFSLAYLFITPLFFGTTSLFDSLTVNGYIVADFPLLFGIFLLLRTSYSYREGSMSVVWLTFALAFLCVFIFDLYFAFFWKMMFFGHMAELLIIASYILIILGFQFNISIVDDVRSYIQEVKSKPTPIKRANTFWFGYSVLATLAFIGLLFFSLQLGNDSLPVQLGLPEQRDDYTLVFSDGVLDRLNQEYDPYGLEYLFCLIGTQEDNFIKITGLTSEQLRVRTNDLLVFENDPPCQVEGAIGSIHSHRQDYCQPSKDDLFTFGHMKDPEPLINIIQCGHDTFNILKMPPDHQHFDFRTLGWTVEYS